MKHEEIRHKLSEYIDGAVTPQERAAIEEHLMTCTSCADALAELRKIIEQVKQLDEVEAPAWMTSKIMANVRAEAAEKKGLFQRLFYPLAVKLPIQAVGVLFLTVTAYYIYSSTHPAERYGEAPIGRIAKQDAPPPERDAERGKAVDAPAGLEKKAAGEPGYRSLDMKYSYEKPAAPVPAEQPAAAPAASAPSPAKRAAPMTAKDQAAPAEGEAVVERRALEERKKIAEPSLMTEKSAKAAGRARAPETPAGASVEQDVDRDAEARLAVLEQFAKHDLPAKMKVQGLRYDVRKVHDGLADLRWLAKTESYSAKPCAERYVVEVNLSGSLSKYLYCHDRSRVTLLGVYELLEGVWSEKRPSLSR